MNFIEATIAKALFAIALLSIASAGAHAGTSTQSAAPAPVTPVANPCPRFAAGSVVQDPPALFSHHGVLSADFSWQTTTDKDGRHLYCFMTPDGLENPTLYLFPGDHLMIKVTNNTPAAPVEMRIDPPNCGALTMTASSLNIHYHGTNTSPTCHQDDVLHTIINSGQTFTYDVHIPSDEPPGLYWYHPHIHMHVEPELQGGGSGAIVVEGIQDFQPRVAGLRQQVFVIRDQNLAGSPIESPDVPSWDLTVNNVPISFPDEIPAVIRIGAGERQLWRVSNSSADSISTFNSSSTACLRPCKLSDSTVCRPVLRTAAGAAKSSRPKMF